MYKINGPTLFSNRTNSRNHAEFNFIIQLPHHFAFRINLDQLGVFPFTGFAVVPLPVTDIKSPILQRKELGYKKELYTFYVIGIHPANNPVLFKIQLHETMSVSTSNQTVSVVQKSRGKRSTGELYTIQQLTIRGNFAHFRSGK